MPLADPGAFKPTPVFRESRKRALTRLTLVRSGGAVHEIMVRDFSSRGFSAAVQGDSPAANEVVTVLMPDDRAVWGLVRWVEDNLFGVEFDLNTPQPATSKPGSQGLARR